MNASAHIRTPFMALCKLVCEDNHDSVMRQATLLLAEFYEAQACVLMLLEASAQRLVPASGVHLGNVNWGPGFQTVDIEQDRLSGGPLARVALTGKPLVYAKANGGYDTQILSELLGHAFATGLVLPLHKLNDNLLGVVVMSGLPEAATKLISSSEGKLLLRAISMVISERLEKQTRGEAERALRKSLDHADRDRHALRARITSGLEAKFPGDSNSILNLRKAILKLTNFNGTISVFGPDGCGKDRVAREIHMASRKHRSPFVYVNCHHLTRENFALLMFGCKRGAIGGETAARKGYLREAGEGTVYFDRIDLLQDDLGNEFIRLLENKRFRTLGSEREIPLHARLVFSANTSARSEGQASGLDDSLFYRIAQSFVVVPPVSSRREDIPVLAVQITQNLSNELRRTLDLDPAVVSWLRAQPLAGDVKELEGMLAHSVKHLPEEESLITLDTLNNRPQAFEESKDDEGSLPELLADFERRLLEATLRKHDHNRARAALDLKIPKRTLADKCKKYHIS